MPAQVETRHHLPLETLQPYLVRSLASTVFSPTSSQAAGPSGDEGVSKRTGWGDLKRAKQFSVSIGWMLGLKVRWLIERFPLAYTVRAGESSPPCQN
jgi:hypothetical protein